MEVELLFESINAWIPSWLRWLALGGAILSIALAEVSPHVTSVGTTLVHQLTPAHVPTPATDDLRFLTANLWHDFPRYRNLSARWAMLAAAMRQERVDVACLQEVPWTDHVDNRARWLGQTLGMAYVYGRANGNQDVLGFEEGLAIVSRYPLRDPRLVEVQPAASPFEHRAVLRAVVQASAGEVVVYCVHLSTNSRARAAQIAWLADFVERDASGQTALIAGDFNAGERSPSMRSLSDRWQDSYRAIHPYDDPGTTFSFDLPLAGTILNARFDYIFQQAGRTPLAVADSRLLFTGAVQVSDHRSVLTIFH